MSLLQLFASIRERVRRSAQQSTQEDGAQITKRLQELLGAPNAAQLDSLPPTPAGKTTENCVETGKTMSAAASGSTEPMVAA